jgi:hypothetical protein
MTSCLWTQANNPPSGWMKKSVHISYHTEIGWVRGD